MRFEFPFNLIGKSTIAFSTGQSWRVLKSWYTAGGPEGGFRRSLADGLNQRVVSSVAQAKSLVEQAFPYWRLSTNTRQRFTAQHKHISLQLLINAVERQTFLPLSSFAGGKFLCRQLSVDLIPRGCPRENVECGPEAANGTQRQYLSDSEIYPKIQLSKSSRSSYMYKVFKLLLFTSWPFGMFDLRTCLMIQGL